MPLPKAAGVPRLRYRNRQVIHFFMVLCASLPRVFRLGCWASHPHLHLNANLDVDDNTGYSSFMSSFFRFIAAWPQSLFLFNASPSANEDPDRAQDITRQIRKISSRPIGFGGYSDIYTGIWRSATGDLKVAIKVIRAVPITAESNQMPRALRRELSVWKRLRHRNIHVLCGLYEGIGPVPALVSPWYENGDIKSYLQRQVESPDIELTKLRLLCDIMCGLKFLHSNSIVHGDIKGQNVLISDAGVATLCDFGLARILAEHSQSVTCTGVRGTSRWMAPEIFLDGEPHSYASDIWGCGCLFIEVWNNILPYHTKTNDHQLSFALDAKELPGSQLDMPDTVWTCVRSCCSFDTTQRPAALQVMTHLCLQLVMQRVDGWLTLSRPIDVPVRNLLQGVEASLRASALQSMGELYILADSELASEVLRYLSLTSVTDAAGHQQVSPEVFHWCLAKFGDGNLHLIPAGVHIPTADNDNVFTMLSALLEPETLRPLARLVERARPGLVKQSSTPLSPPLSIDEMSCSVAWFRDSDRIVAGCNDGTIYILDLATGTTLRRQLVGHMDDVRQVSVSPDGRLLTSCSYGKRIRLWDAETGLNFGVPMVGHYGYVYSVAFSPDSRRIVSGSYDDTIRIWSTETCRTVLGPLLGHTGTVTSVAYSPDGARIVSGSRDMTVRVWHARTGDPVMTIRGHIGRVRSVVYSPDGSRIVSGSGDDTIRTWDATTGQLVGSLLGEHSESVLSVAYSPDGTRIASGSRDSTIRIWDAATGEAVAMIRGHTERVSSVVFSPDGKRLASALRDGTVRIWDATYDLRRWGI